ncbi:hypothetical protein MTE01_30860 [Microbacterium testaceum]|uniref:Uncharacterized protein n=1 Tax=Microbacterium testaceum TaxID=2033 RepID=A0A4Y3QPR1_MICTE|nr:hypothetical protein [Microbacterium testaceum]GEB47141.1 hypothetical protein MTE01_30860 [Microbacterium testaceum]
MRSFSARIHDPEQPKPLGCPACLDLAMREGQPAFIVATSPDDLLYRCDYCQTWWTANSRFRNPATVADAQARFPEQRIASSPAVDDAQLSEAIVLFTGWGATPEPIDDVARVAARFPKEFPALEPVLAAFVRGSTSIVFHEVAPSDDGLLGRVRARLRLIMPRLCDDALDALTWRWPFVVPQTSSF